jgi:hypothetical protein
MKQIQTHPWLALFYKISSAEFAINTYNQLNKPMAIYIRN